jgi:hypothetical protein
VKTFFKFLFNIFASQPIKISALVGAVATGATMIASGQTEMGVGIILAGVSSNTALKVRVGPLGGSE